MRQIYKEGPASGRVTVQFVRCTLCLQDLPLDAFYPHNRSRTGVGTRCKECYKAQLTVSYRKRPEKFLLRAAKNRARDKGVPFGITEKDIVIPVLCPVLGLTLEPIRAGMHQRAGSLSIDEVIPGKGYVPGNVAVISWRANSLKRDGLLPEFQQLVRWLSQFCDGVACEIDYSKPRGATN